MFIPRQLQISTASSSRTTLKRKLSAAASIPPTSTSASKPSALAPASEPPAKKPKPEIDHTVAKELVFALEQLFGSINPHTSWLQERYRKVDGHDDYIHLMSLVDCPYFQYNRPPLTQALLRKALNSSPSDVLQLSDDGYHLRLRDPSTRVKLEDSHTVYIEPAVSGVTLRPGQVARQMHQTLPEKLQPVRFVQTGGKSWALVALAGEVREDEEEVAWWPKDWMVLRKEEWRKREREYIEYRKRCIQEQLDARRAAQEHAAAETVYGVEGHGEEEEYAEDVMEVDASEKHQEEQTWYTKGLLVRILHLHPATNKNTIRSLLDNICEKYAKKQKKKHPDRELPKRADIQYIDYTKGLDTATVRVKVPEDATLIVDALKKRRRVMEKEDDVKGRKGDKAEGKWVVGEVLGGEVERRYWEGIEAAKAPKGRKRGKKR